MKSWNIDHYFASLRDAKANGPVEFVYKIMLDVLQKRVDALGGNFDEELKNVLRVI